MRFSPNHFLTAAVAALCLAHCTKSAPMSWPELTALDAKAERGEGLAERHDVKGMKAFLPELLPVATAFLASPVPTGAGNPAATSELRKDLQDLVTHLSAAGLSDTDLESFIAGLHPIVEQLMTQSGMPHIHADPTKK